MREGHRAWPRRDWGPLLCCGAGTLVEVFWTLAFGGEPLRGFNLTNMAFVPEGAEAEDIAVGLNREGECTRPLFQKRRLQACSGGGEPSARVTYVHPAHRRLQVGMRIVRIVLDPI